MATILTRKGIAITVDDADLSWLSKYKWRGYFVNQNWRVLTTVRENGRNRIVKMSRLIMSPPDDLLVDHRDCNGLNNCRSNLRIATRHQNQQNRKYCCGKSKYKGVYWHTKRKRWLARVMVNGKKVDVGASESEIEAAELYDRAAKKHYGEFARTNF